MKPQDMVDLLNEALQLDHEAVNQLIDHRVPCNEKLAEHPTIQVTSDSLVGMLGILNGMVGKENDNICIYADYDGSGVLTNFGLKPKFADSKFAPQ